ncbi:probable xyloglucan 6-xylosyltransferase 3 [Quercus suber]|uniref:probable xyloglucan 6-xylosyltransferase 3 n=1 Tax=Quercus suber TaxID=58331 RepID=UPI0032DEB264
MGPKGAVRDEAGKILTANLKGRPAFEANDQSALIYLLISRKDEWMDKVFVENSYYLHGYWAGLVDRYEEMMEKCHPGLGDERWPFVTHFVGCKPCGSYGDYAVERCLSSMERAYNFADNQVLKLFGFRHRVFVVLDFGVSSSTHSFVFYLAQLKVSVVDKDVRHIPLLTVYRS